MTEEKIIAVLICRCSMSLLFDFAVLLRILARLASTVSILKFSVRDIEYLYFLTTQKKTRQNEIS